MGRICTKCSTYKNSQFFSKDKSSSSGLQRWCKDCTRSWRKENAESIKTKQRQNYLKERDLRLAKNREYYQKHKEEIVSQKSVYSKNNPEIKRRASLKRRVIMANNNSFLILPKEIKKLYNSECIYCGSREKIQADHVIPVTRGGTNSIGNLVPACYICNPSKGNRTIMEWRKSKILSARIS